ncbi:hypothetical protein ADP71_10950 [Vitreoscilla sp. C1]|uniref:hypothetical protein n=1 Tax=Vitreoscilla sp. (strain C1) TaxID=96942 RepID=UPI000CDBAF0A|nr:hypothetical protein [Vitreoscilla sp. C1]AUZ04773.1 hypothetical protein ADP71_10950 [Vitreoscilla sp. C1]
MNDFDADEYEDDSSDSRDVEDMFVMCGGDMADGMDEEEMRDWIDRQMPDS